MFQHYIKTTYRYIGRNKINFIFKLGGLALAIISLLVIVVYVSYQLSFDRFHQDHENVYRINSNREEDGQIVPYAMVPPAIGPALKEAFPEIKAYTRMSIPSRVMVRYQDKLFRFNGVAEADSTLFDVLSFTFIRGDKRALQTPGSIVLTETLAKQIFGKEDPMGKVITSPDHGEKTLRVSAVIKDFPVNAHLHITAIHTFGALMKSDLDSWEITWDGSLNLYVRLAPGTNPHELTDKALPILKKNLVKAADGSEKRFSLYPQTVADIYLDKPLKMEFGKKGVALYVYIFSLLGVLILIIASINYVNLSIADFDTRTREMGVRKVLGARKLQIGFQVALEAVIITGIGLLIALAVLYQFFPVVTEKLDPNLRFEMLWHHNVVTITFLLLALLVVISSVYPWYRLTSQSPAVELKANAGYGSSMSVGKALLLIQYAISILCICATVIIWKQINFVWDTDVGYDRSHVVSLVMPDEYPGERAAILKNEIKRLAGVESVSYSYYLMPISTYFKGWYQVEQNGKMEPMLLNEMFVDHDYFETMGMKVIAGRNFQLSNATDARQAFIINETAARQFGWSDPVGKAMKLGYDGESTEVQEGTVVGVVKDFNTLSLHRKIEPVILRLQYDNWPGNSLNVKVRGDVAKILPVVISAYERLMPGFLADARLLEDLHKNQYKSEDNAFSALQIGTVVIVLISALGIFSLSLYMSVKRMREFGIRRVLGATTMQIASLHANFFLSIGALANVIALPVAYWIMRAWLENFAYRTEVSLLLFFVVMCISFLLVLISGGYSAWKAGRMNPVDVIKIQ
ncbi:MAG TPA: FtsX-like permease family protein [Ohtaekwangia sp.]|nr:FtsX-like permease family protein [Ohtaekwangia sp.]